MEKLYFVGNAHIDPVWRWRWQEGFAEIKATFAAALERIEEYGDKGFVFTCAGASYYEWIEENCPELFARIQKAVRDGSWKIVGGMRIQPDCNLPSGESFARQALYSQRYFREKFGVEVSVGYNVDSFGHAGTLPMLLKESGLNAYVFKRPSIEENSDIPYAFHWESPDGTRVVGLRIPHDYGDVGSAESFHDHLAECLKCGDETHLPIMCFIGVGNHGGGPTITVVDECLKLMEQDSRYVFGTPEDCLENLRTSGKLESLPVYAEELQHHASGCYSTTAALKAANRRAEHRLYAAEAAMACANAILDLPYDHDAVKSAWERVLFNQFHDTMGGCIIPEAYEDAMEQYGEALSVSARLYNAAVQKISWAVNTMPEGGTKLTKEYNRRKWERENGGAPVIVWNPHAFPIECEVECLQLAKAVTDSAGRMLPMQAVRASRTGGAEGNYDTLFRVRVPAFGYQSCFMYVETTPESGEVNFPAVTVQEQGTIIRLANGVVALEVDRHTGLAVLTDAAGEILADSCGLVDVRDDYQNDTWAHDVWRFDRHIGFAHDVQVCVVERGPLRASVRVTAKWGSSTVVQEYFLASDRNEVECKVALNWQEAYKTVKIGFRLPGAVECEYEMPYGSTVRPCDGEEEPGHAWVDIRSAGRGLTVMNDAKYSYSAEGDMLYITALRTTAYSDQNNDMRDGEERIADIGRSEFHYVLAPHKSFDRLAAVRRARLLNLAPVVVPETWHYGPLPLEKSFASAENAVISAIKHAEDDNGTIVRVFNPEGVSVEASIDLEYMGESFAVPLGKYEVATYRIVKGREPERVDFTEMERG